MKYCNVCQVKVENNIRRCPLCEKELQELDGVYKQDYPNIRSSKLFRTIVKLVFLVSLVAVGASFVLDYLNPTQVLWSVIVLAGIIYLWINFWIALKLKKNWGLTVLIQIISISLFCMVIDWTVNDWARWSINYVVPGLIIAGSVFITVITIVKPMNFRDYIIYLLEIAILGLLSLLLVWLHLSTVRWTLITAAFYSVGTFLGMFLFADRKTKHELKKRFHF